MKTKLRYVIEVKDETKLYYKIFSNEEEAYKFYEKFKKTKVDDYNGKGIATIVMFKVKADFILVKQIYKMKDEAEIIKINVFTEKGLVMTDSTIEGGQQLINKAEFNKRYRILKDML